MSETDVVVRFSHLVDRFAQIQGWMDKARDIADRFNPIVVERVVNGHQQSLETLLVDIIPMLYDVEAESKTAERRKADVEAGVAAAKQAIEEIDLRLLIGEINDAEAADASAPHKAEIDAVSVALADAEERLAAVAAALQRWEDTGRSAGVLQR